MPRAFPCATGPALAEGRKGCAACCYHTPWDEPGVPCKALDLETHLCRLYDVDGVDLRPPICSVRGVWERHGQSSMTWSDFIEVNLDACAVMIPAVTEDARDSQLFLLSIGR